MKQIVQWNVEQTIDLLNKSVLLNKIVEQILVFVEQNALLLSKMQFVEQKAVLFNRFCLRFSFLFNR